MVYTLIRQGRLVLIGGGWSMADEATTNYHAIIDSHTFSLRKINATFWECGRPLVAWQADVMGHSREFASLAAQMGYDALFINPISFDDELQRMQRWALEMLWRGSDDLGPKSDIFTHKLFDGYWSPPGFCFSSLCQDPLIVTSDLAFNNVEERAQTFVDVIYNRQAPNYNTSHVMVMMGHVNGYFDAPMWFANIDALINAVNARSTTGKQKMYVFYSTPACYAKAVHESNITLETKQDDFFPMAYDKTSYLTGFYTSCPSIKYMARIAMVYLQMCKQMKVLAEIGPEYNKLFEELNWIVGAFQDHSIITGAMRDHVKSYYIEKHYTAVQRSTILLREAWNKLRKCPTETKYYRCSLNISQCHFLIGDSFFVQIYNPLGWAGDDAGAGADVVFPVRVPSPRPQG
ncbi:hypothetical protein O0L34_g15719 [Tuta absoluta]|nr:hypothetical protein O0L34_g15719 [Tuta absoluta]